MSVPDYTIEWKLEDFDGQVAHLRLDYEGVDTSLYDRVDIIVKDNNGQINSDSGKYLKTKETSIKIAPFIDHKEAKRIESIFTIMMILLASALAINFMIALFFKSSLINAWVCISTIQLLLHIPIFQARLPPNAHFFINKLLSIVRLHESTFNASVDDITT